MDTTTVAAVAAAVCGTGLQRQHQARHLRLRSALAAQLEPETNPAAALTLCFRQLRALAAAVQVVVLETMPEQMAALEAVPAARQRAAATTAALQLL